MKAQIPSNITESWQVQIQIQIQKNQQMQETKTEQLVISQSEVKY